MKLTTLIHKYPELWKKENPGKIALIHNESGKQLMYHQFAYLIDKLANRLTQSGIQPGDRIAVLLPRGIEGIALLYACAKVGAIYVPMSLHIPKKEFIRRMQLIQPQAFFYIGLSPNGDYRIVGNAVMHLCPLIPNFIQVDTIQTTSSSVLPGAVSWSDFMRQSHNLFRQAHSRVSNKLRRFQKETHAWSPLIMFFSGENSRPILLCHENLMIQAKLLETEARIDRDTKMLVNQAPASMGYFIHSICATLSQGGTVILTDQSDPLFTHQLIDDYYITHINQSRQQYEAMWAEVEPNVYRHASLNFALFPSCYRSGLHIQDDFLEKMSSFSPDYGTGIHLPEAGGYISFNNKSLFQTCQVSQEYPIKLTRDLTQISIREPMLPNAKAGDELPEDFEGNICIHPPSVFLGYYKEAHQTGRIVTKEGILYAPMQGYLRRNGDEKLLFLTKPEPVKSLYNTVYKPAI